MAIYRRRDIASGGRHCRVWMVSRITSGGFISAIHAANLPVWPLKLVRLGEIKSRRAQHSLSITFSGHSFAMPPETRRVVLEMDSSTKPGKGSFLMATCRLQGKSVSFQVPLVWGTTFSAGDLNVPQISHAPKKHVSEVIHSHPIGIYCRIYWGPQMPKKGLAGVARLIAPSGASNVRLSVFIASHRLVPQRFLLNPYAAVPLNPPILTVDWANSVDAPFGYDSFCYSWESRRAYRTSAGILLAAGCLPWTVDSVIRDARTRLGRLSAENLLLAISGIPPTDQLHWTKRRLLIAMGIASSAAWSGWGRTLVEADFCSGRLYLVSSAVRPNRSTWFLGDSWIYFSDMGAYRGGVILGSPKACLISGWPLRIRAIAAASAAGRPSNQKITHGPGSGGGYKKGGIGNSTRSGLSGAGNN